MFDGDWDSSSFSPISAAPNSDLSSTNRTPFLIFLPLIEPNSHPQPRSSSVYTSRSQTKIINW